MIDRASVTRLAIVNRGEAAMRCIRAVKSLRALEGSDVRCIALYTDVDAAAPFVRHADRAHRLDAPKGAVAAYLDRDGLLDALRACNADAVWPGWGFVAEDPEFAERVAAEGLAFLGPPAEVMRRLGDKIAAKQLAESAGVPVIPWSGGGLSDAADAAAHAKHLGYPLLLKASAGGGGRGIRAVGSEAELEAAFQSAASEARSAFGDPTLFLESRVHGGRHVEVQIAADLHGRVRALGCRDCSVQRRHQKVIEEAPPPGLPADLLASLEAAAVRLAEKVGYTGLGTVEFLVADGKPQFLEVNPRLQVEHGITEELTGLDLVQLQIRIARGEELPDAVNGRGGAAIEARVCAEDPDAGFAPAPGEVAHFDPALGPGIRIDTGVAAGSSVPPDFDSLIAKVIARGETREEARARLVGSLRDFELVLRGGATNKGRLIEILESPAFRSASVDTGWLDRVETGREASGELAVEALVTAAILAYQRSRDAARSAFFDNPGSLSASTIPPSTGQRVDLSRGGESYQLEVFGVGAWRNRVHLDGRVVWATLRADGPHKATLELCGRSLPILHDAQARGFLVEVAGRPHRFSSDQAGQVRAAAPGVVIGLDVAEGDRVEVGQILARLEAMKLEIGVEAPVAGVVGEVFVRAGQQVAAGDLLVVVDNSEEKEAPRGARLALPSTPDPLALFFGPDDADGTPTVDLAAADRAEPAARREGIRAAREEIRRVVMGFDADPSRGERLVAFLEAPLPEGLSEGFRWEVAEIRHELALFADVEQLFVRAPRPSSDGEPGPSRNAQLRSFVRNLRAGGNGISGDFESLLRKALRHYGVTELSAGEVLERALLRLLAGQLRPEIRRRLVFGTLRRIRELAASGIDLGDDRALADALRRTGEMRGLVSDAVADLATETGHLIFEGPELERQAEHTTVEVEAWLAAAEAEMREPPARVLVLLAHAPRSVFDRVGRWLDDPDSQRRAIALAAHLLRLYAPRNPTPLSLSFGETQVERLVLEDGRAVLGRVAKPGQLARDLAQLVERAGGGPVDAIELFVPAGDALVRGELAAELSAALEPSLPAKRVNVTVFPSSGNSAHLAFERTEEGWNQRADLMGLHPETAERIDLARLSHFDLERLDAPDDIYSFHLRSPEVKGDERIFVRADVRGRSPEAGHEMRLHVAAFERAFFEATRTLRNHLLLRDPRRRLQWNRLSLFVAPPIVLEDELVERLSQRLYSATRNLGLEKVVVRLHLLDPDALDAAPRVAEIVIADPTGSHMELSARAIHRAPLLPAQDYERKVVEARRRKLVYPYEIVRMLEGGAGGLGLRADAVELPPGRFEEYDLDPAAEAPVAVSVAGRPYGANESSVVFGVIETATREVPEGMRRVLILSDPTTSMGSLAAPECDRISAALELAERLQLPVEWVPVSSGARIAMDTGTENLDATARVVRRIVTFTQAGGVIHVIVHGVNVGAQSYFDALATMLPHTRGALIMTPGGSMVLTGRAALEVSGSVAAEDEAGIGGFERVMGPNGEAQYFARDLADAFRVLYEHYRYTYVPPGEAGPRAVDSEDASDRCIGETKVEPADGHGFATVGEIFDTGANPDRKRAFSMRAVMRALVDRDGGHLERWRSWRGAETAIVWDARLGGRPVCLIGIESQNLGRPEDRPSDGPTAWTGGTLFPRSSKKVARALSAASGNRPAVILANLSGFDGSPESMRELQLEYGAQIARAVVNFRGPILFLVVSRYHGGAYVVFSRALNPGLRAAALTGSFASVIGGAPAAAVVFTREVRARTSADPRVAALQQAAQGGAGNEAREALERTWKDVRLEKQAELAAEFDGIHTVERAREVGSLETIVAPSQMRAYLIEKLG